MENQFDNFIDEDDYGTMMGHYFFFMINVHQTMFFAISALLFKWNLIKVEANDNTGVSSVAGMICRLIVPLLFWMFCKYHCHFPLEMILYTFFTRFITATSYLYSCFKSSKYLFVEINLLKF